MKFVDLPAKAVAALPNPLESDWTDWVVAHAKRHGWMVVHFRPARTNRGHRTPVQGDTGSPDTLLARDGVVVLRELKRNRTYPRPDQRAWLAACGDTAAVWRPRDAVTVEEYLATAPASSSARRSSNVSRDT